MSKDSPLTLRTKTPITKTTKLVKPLHDETSPSETPTDDAASRQQSKFSLRNVRRVRSALFVSALFYTTFAPNWMKMKHIGLCFCFTLRVLCLLYALVPGSDCALNCDADFYHNLWFTGLGPDFALGTAGGNIVAEMTTPTLGLSFSSSYRSSASAWNAYYQVEDSDIVPPLVVIDDQLRIGQCWSIANDKGHITIQLAAPINVTHFTFYYPDYREVRVPDLQAAPKNIVAWVLVDEENLGTKRTAFVTRPAQYFACGKKKADPTLTRGKLFVQALSLEFTPQKGVKQSFKTDPGVKELVAGVIVVQILNNWGADHTCLYRVAVNGEENLRDSAA
ncbi:SUN domain-containing protein 3 [Stygiomarasmius scandens]|uniref:SUN domain-containing protein 3 n=1 Tax=Marasmiellus scandens TaxID=2682957 RepID=A0ABR1J0U6_9AGAR